MIHRFCYLALMLATSWLLLLTGCSQSEKEPDFEAYLFTYFVGNGPGQESIHYAISRDGYHFWALNDNEPIISSDSISHSGGVRDPHILRGEDGMFYMVVTDLYVPEMGWSNHAMVMLKSKDLINWTSSVVDIHEEFAEEFGTVSRVWAPQTIYDPASQRYMLYWSMKTGDDPDKIYYAFANEDFTGLATTPKQLYLSPTNSSCIDGDIIYDEGKYHLFFKNSGSATGILKAVSDSLTGGYVGSEEYMDQTDESVEGSGIFKLIDSDEYILMYDLYHSGGYQFCRSTDLQNFEVIDEEISMNFHPRHGTVIGITRAEANALIAEYGSMASGAVFGADAPAVKQTNLIVNEAEQEVTLPVKPGTDLTSFDPQLKLMTGATASPDGPQDFSQRPVSYEVSLNGQKWTYEVSAQLNSNPVLEGYYADPEIIYSEKDQKFYLYPTTDGFTGWSGTYFETFSSTDLVNWTPEGKILDLETDVDWAERHAWAPCAIEKEIDGEYKYFYYFTAAQKIGVGVADEPTGPFIDKGEPIIGFKPEGINRGQEIDPDVFEDPVSGKTYLYWGNGYMAVVELNEDMVSFDMASLKILTPADGTFREGTEVFYREGTYYFLWSENDTRSPDYRVRYATAPSPLGPLTIAEDNLILEKRPDEGIYGTGHNSVIQVPGKDEWYIVYHRFTIPKGIEMGRAAGFHRETCIDRMTFDAEGYIVDIVPTLEGIEPVSE